MTGAADTLKDTPANTANKKNAISCKHFIFNTHTPVEITYDRQDLIADKVRGSAFSYFSLVKLDIIRLEEKS